jgi:hypothetical protein
MAVEIKQVDQCQHATMTSGVGHTVRSNGFGRAIWDVQLFVPKKYTNITALIRAFHRAIAQIT